MSSLTLSIHSDLHLEFDDEAGHEFDLDLTDVDVLILAGDIHMGRQAVTYLTKWAAHVPNILYIAGNHEYYMNDFDKLFPDIKTMAAAIPGVVVMENDEVIIKGTRFLGCTMWTDMHRGSVRALRLAEDRMNDYHLVHRGKAKLRGRDTVNRHDQSKEWLTGKLKQPFSGPTVVITHHLPTPFVVAEEFKHDYLSAAYASTDLDPLITECDLWVFGHQHTTTLKTVDRADQGKTILLSNPRGYYPQRLNENYEQRQRFLIEPRKQA